MLADIVISSPSTANGLRNEILSTERSGLEYTVISLYASLFS